MNGRKEPVRAYKCSRDGPDGYLLEGDPNKVNPNEDYPFYKSLRQVSERQSLSSIYSACAQDIYATPFSIDLTRTDSKSHQGMQAFRADCDAALVRDCDLTVPC